ncbi:hypothetical protein QOZ80_2BG0164720 [Eleusine coracana subsp. coracana]|nr:hypothetical protein QOZ80_2BG0164720 [Eleusine coracana subsp. coracana]
MAAWAGLRLNLVGDILTRLPCRAHRAAFGAVCANWRRVATQRPAPPQLPWLLFPSAAAEAPVFICLLCRTTHRAVLPDDVRSARCCGSHPGGWLLLRFQQHQGGGFEVHNIQPQGGGLALYNLRTGVRLDVPDDLRTVNGFSDTGIVLGAALSAAPTMPGCCLAVVQAFSASQIAFWFPEIGMPYQSQPMAPEPHERGRRVMLPNAWIDDVIYFAGYGLGGFHVLTNAEEVLVYIPGFGPDGAFTTYLVTYRFPEHQVSAEPGCTACRYLVDYFSRLVMVVRFVSTEDQRTRRIRSYVLRMAAVQAGHLGDRQAYWVECWFLGDNRVVMLGRCSSMAFDSPAVGLNGLYFLDDARSFDDVIAALQFGPLYPCRDMGRCTVHHQPHQYVLEHLGLILPMRPPSVFSPPVWFFH